MVGGYEVIDGSTVRVSGGELGYFKTLSDSTLLVDGGWLQKVNTRNSQIDISGGVVGITTRSDAPSSVKLRGGTPGRLFRIGDNSTLEVHGSNFEIDGQPVDLQVLGQSKDVQISQGSLFTGILTDGTPFAIHSADGDVLAEEVTLVRTEIASVGPLVINTSSGSAPYGLRAGQTLNLFPGGEIGPSFQAGTGSYVNVLGGLIGEDFEAFGAEITIMDGSFGRGFAAFDGADIHILGGQLSRFEAYRGSSVVIDGGSVGPNFFVYDGAAAIINAGNIDAHSGVFAGSTMEVRGGNIGRSFSVRGDIIIEGGTFGDRLIVGSGSSAKLRGFDFRINGELIDGLDNTSDAALFDPPAGSLFTGVLADGTPFLFTSRENDQFAEGALLLERVDTVPVESATINIPTDPTPLGIRDGQTINVVTEGRLADNFTTSQRSIVNVHGGTIGSNFESIGSEINVFDGQISYDWDLFDGGVLNLYGGGVERGEVHQGGTMNIEGGAVHSTLSIREGGTVNVHGGAISQIEAEAGSMVNIKGGEILGSLQAIGGAIVNIDGGTIGSGPRSYPQTRSAVIANAERLDIRGGYFGDLFSSWTNTTTMYGRDFRLNGEVITGLQEVGATAVVNFPDQWILSGILEDGSPFLFTQAEGDYFQSGSIGGLTLVRTSDEILPPQILEIPSDPAPKGVSDGQQLTLDSGGKLPNNFVALHGSQILIHDGIIGTNFEAMGAWVEINGGTVGDGFDAFDKTYFLINDGIIGSEFSAHSGSVLKLSGGYLGSVQLVDAEAELNGATVAELSASGARLRINGGTIEGEFRARFSEVTIFGSEFLLNGEPIPGLSNVGDSIELEPSAFSSLLTGVLQDGTPLHAELTLGYYSPPRLVAGSSTDAALRSYSSLAGETAFHRFIGESVTFRVTLIPEPYSASPND